MTPGPAPRRRVGILRWLLAAVILLPLVEIVVLVAVGRSIGVLWTIGLLVAMALLGTWLSRREGGRTVRALQEAVQTGRMPAREATDAILVALGGFLLVLPGFLSDVLGLFLVLPFTRPAARGLLTWVVSRQAARLGVTTAGASYRRTSSGAEGVVIEGEIIADEPGPGTRPEDGRGRLEA